jgi:hypothetical protein
MMVVLLLYSYCVGIPSSRRIERACWEDAAFRVLTGNQQPDHSRISDFRLVHLDGLAGLFVQVLRLCQKAGLVSLGNVALDGTKVKANASKHKAMSHERMLKTEAELEAEIAALLRKAELIDAQEDARYGKGKRGDEFPKELERRQDRLDALRKIIAEPVFGQIKGARGLDRFLLRGLEKVEGEWTLMAITHNIGKLHRAALAAT